MLHTAVLLDATTPLNEARTRIETHAASAYVVLRRQVQLALTFHVFRAGELLAQIAVPRGNAADVADTAADNDGGIPLQTVLRLDEAERAPVIQLADFRGSLLHIGSVVLDGTSVLGVCGLPPGAVMARSLHIDRPGADVPIQASRSAPVRTPTPASAPAPAPAATAARVDAPVEPADPPRRTRGGGGKLTVTRPAPSAPPRTRGFSGISGRDAGGRSPGVAGAGGGSGSSVAETGGALELEHAPAPLEHAPVRFDAHAQLDLEKDVVAPGERFELGIGLGATAQPGVIGGAIRAELPAGTRDFDLDVHLVADGFEAPSGWHFRLHVPVSEPDRARLSVALIAPRDAITRLSLLEVHFAYRGVPCGVAFRRIAVQPAQPAHAVISEIPTSHSTPWIDADIRVSAATLHIDPADPAPDLTITISKPDGNDATGRYYWSFTSQHDVAIPRSPIAVDLGDDARTFAGRMIQLVTRAEGTPLIDQALNGLGRQVRDKAPRELEDVLRAVWRAVLPTGRVPTILLHSAEPHVPWELARLDDPPDPNAPPFLGAQFAVGRWILGPRGMRVPPVREVLVRAMAVVAGDYRSSLNLRPLPKAETEGKELEQRWGAVRLAATIDHMDSLLEATLVSNGVLVGGADVIHFACHGEVDARNPGDAMIFLDNDWPLDPSLFLDAPVGRSNGPFLFLNACQVGQAGEMLGDYAGFAGCCLRAGFRGFVAPLWSVSDDIALEIALEFYDRAFDNGDATVAEILRELRSRYPADERVPPSTWLAYVFYGNPAFRLRRAPE